MISASIRKVCLVSLVALMAQDASATAAPGPRYPMYALLKCANGPAVIYRIDTPEERTLVERYMAGEAQVREIWQHLFEHNDYPLYLRQAMATELVAFDAACVRPGKVIIDGEHSA